MTEEKFFICGSFSEGYIHYSLIKNFITSVKESSVRGSAYRNKVGFPSLVEAGNDLVPGHLVTVEASELLFKIMDEFYGLNIGTPLYMKKKIAVMTAEGFVDAWAYVLPTEQLPAEWSYIPEGNWIEFLKKNPALPEKLTEKQKGYVVKLGKASGRNMIPMDYTTYRELLSLEIIVDKGRRFALSKLGHEVFRYLQ